MTVSYGSASKSKKKERKKRKEKSSDGGEQTEKKNINQKKTRRKLTMIVSKFEIRAQEKVVEHCITILSFRNKLK